MFWTIAALLIGLVAAIPAVAMLRSKGIGTLPGEPDVALYKDQLAEIDRDQARGLLSVADAESARLDVSRRLLEADKRMSEADIKTGSNPEMVAGAVGAGIIGLTLVVYAQIGAPDLPDQPLELRHAIAQEFYATRPSQAEVEASQDVQPPAITSENSDFAALVQKLRDAVAENPDDLQGHKLLAENEARLGDFVAAHKAQGKVIALLGDNASDKDWADYADLLVLAVQGYVSPQAETAVQNALEINPQNGVARYYAGLMFAQIGRADRGFTIWRNLLESSSPQDPWHQAILRQIGPLSAQAGIRYSPPQVAPLAGPSAEDVANAAELSAEDRAAMIEGMVSGLAERLASEGGTAQEWARLITALGVLDRKDEAQNIAEEARAVFASQPGALALIEEAAGSLNP